MRIITVADAELRFAELLDLAERGESVVLTRDGKTVAQLIPANLPKQAGSKKPEKPLLSEAEKRAARLLAVDELIKARAQYMPTGMTRDDVRQLIRDSRPQPE